MLQHLLALAVRVDDNEKYIEAIQELDKHQQERLMLCLKNMEEGTNGTDMKDMDRSSLEKENSELKAELVSPKPAYSSLASLSSDRGIGRAESPNCGPSHRAVLH